MCGITGLFTTTAQPVNAHLIGQMTQRLRHRGPDGGGIALIGADGLVVHDASSELPAAEGTCRGGMGHRRLSVIDLECGFQPMVDDSRRYCLVFNGEIYNYRQLRSELEALGAKFQTRSDTEVLLQALIEWGHDALKRLEGMFAFALWDAREQTLLLGRDRIGIKPLYYSDSGGVFTFGSEIKAILECPSVDSRADRSALTDYLMFRYVPGPGTIYKNIRSLPPAHYMYVRLGTNRPSLNPVRWWSLDAGQVRDVSMDEAKEELDALLSEVCRDHLVSDVPVGVFLSGGIDSSAVLAHSQAHASRPLECISVGFGKHEFGRYNEGDAAERIARHLGARLHALNLDESLLGLLDTTLEALDEPMADPSVLPSLEMMEAARDRAKVMLAGDGGDEVFGGYQRYRRVLKRLARARSQNVFRRLHHWIGRHPTVDPMAAYLEKIASVPSSELEELVRPEFRPDEMPPRLDTRYPRHPNRDWLNRWQQLDFHTYMTEDNLKKVDRTSMAYGVEVRVPLLDRRIVEFGFKLDSRLLLDGKNTKLVLRRSLESHLPAEILNRKKIGFKVPLREWAREKGPNPMLDPFLRESEPIWGLVRRPVVLRWVSEHQADLHDHKDPLWTLIVLNAWLRSRKVGWAD